MGCSDQGTYYVAAGSLGNQSGGSFVLEAKRKEDDAADRLSSAFSYEAVAPGTSKDGELEIEEIEIGTKRCYKRTRLIR